MSSTRTAYSPRVWTLEAGPALEVRKQLNQARPPKPMALKKKN